MSLDAVNYKGWGYPATKERAEQTFTALDQDWWKQIYDGIYHRFGQMVFDEGLHKPKAKEPGFYASAHKAFHYAKENLYQKVTVGFYHRLHKEACAHFKGKENYTAMHAWDAGKFRGRGDSVRYSLSASDVILFLYRKSSHFSSTKSEAVRTFSSLRAYHGDESSYEGQLEEFRQLGKALPSVEESREFEAALNRLFEDLKASLKQLEEDPLLRGCLPTIVLDRQTLRFSYSPFDFEKVIAALFEKFNREMDEMNANFASLDPEVSKSLADSKLTLIADFYQKIEWLHPYKDGQGRTDLMLLSMVLCEQGFHPAILDYPYASTFVPLKEWKEYLKEGMNVWESQLAKKLSPLHLS